MITLSAFRQVPDFAQGLGGAICACGIVTSDRRLAAYIGRCTARPEFERALDAQMADFKLAA
jgi:hypothetical protein